MLLKLIKQSFFSFWLNIDQKIAWPAAKGNNIPSTDGLNQQNDQKMDTDTMWLKLVTTFDLDKMYKLYKNQFLANTSH